VGSAEPEKERERKKKMWDLGYLNQEEKKNHNMQAPSQLLYGNVKSSSVICDFTVRW
jgi:hypothetical protein